MHKLAIFASGGGSNAEKIIDHFRTVSDHEVSLIVTNNPAAGVIEKAKRSGIPYIIESGGSNQLKALQENNIDFIALAGYLKLIGPELLAAYPNRIVNIHPALLPKFGGRGMHGMNVHRAVKEAGEKESGMTIHYVNENYDDGAIIEQHKCEVFESDTAEDIAARVLKLEHNFYGPCLEHLLNEL